MQTILTATKSGSQTAALKSHTVKMTASSENFQMYYKRNLNYIK